MIYGYPQRFISRRIVCHIIPWYLESPHAQQQCACLLDIETCEYQRRGLHSSRFRHLMSYTLVYLVHEYPIIKSKYPIVLQKRTNTVSGRSLRPRPKRVIWRGNYPAGYERNGYMRLCCIRHPRFIAELCRMNPTSWPRRRCLSCHPRKPSTAQPRCGKSGWRSSPPAERACLATFAPGAPRTTAG